MLPIITELLTDIPQAPGELFAPIGNKKIKQKVELFCKFVEENHDKRFCICSHDNPDPDSIAAASGMSWILQFLDVENVEMVYCGEISHPQNRTMLNILDIPMKPWSKVENFYNDHQKETVFIYVDCSNNTQKNMSIRFQPNMVLDHHKATANKNALVINDEVGAASTLITDLALSITKQGETKILSCFDTNEEGLKSLATALAIGIKTDTLDFRSESTTEDDFRAYKLLSRVLSDDKFHSVINYELPPYIFDAEKLAWDNKNETYSPNLVSGLGYLESTQSDCIPYLADKMMRIKGVQTVVIYAIIIDENVIRASIRTVSSSLDIQQLSNYVFGEDNGGGKQGCGGAIVKFNVFNVADIDDDSKTSLWNLVQKQISQKFNKITQK